MYKLLLSWRYLRTRFIAMASIVSVTLGVATLIVVNSVMNGFSTEMQQHLHGILADIEMSSPGIGEIPSPEFHLQEIQRVVGDDLEMMTCLVRVPALVTMDFGGRKWTQQIMLLGVDERTFGKVCEIHPYLMNRNNRESMNFLLQEDGYDPRIGECGWSYRREKAAAELQVQRVLQSEKHREALDRMIDAPQTAANFVPPVLPTEVPNINEIIAEQESAGVEPETRQMAISPLDPHARYRQTLRPDEMFNPARDQRPGIILGIGLAHRYVIEPDSDEKTELFLTRPGDDVQIMLPSSGGSYQPVIERCTVVDLYESNMHEYDSSFAFMPLERLQKIRNMIDPVTGIANVSAIHMRFREGTNLDEAKTKIEKHFYGSYSYFPYVIQTWMDTQRPLLSAVEVELTILNILLFLIIAVAGFGILATFFMIVVEKTRDIGILKALGAPASGVMSIFLNYGLCLGALGTGAGIVIGLVFVDQINNIADGIKWITGREVFDPTMYFFSEIPTIVSPWMVVWVAFGAMMIAVLASVLPALRAARMHPVEALRYE